MYPGEHAQNHPDEPALIMATSGAQLTFGEYEANCNRLAHLFRAAGLQPGDHVAMFLENNLRYFELQGAVEAATLTPQVEVFLCIDTDHAIGPFQPYDTAIAEHPPTPIDDERLGAAMLYSSGTTGRPKGILRPLPDVAPGEGLALMGFIKQMFQFREGMRYLSPAPLYHSAPQASVSATMRLGGTSVIMEPRARCR